MSLRRLFIVGAGGLGRELESWLDRVPRPDRDWRIHGYIDDAPDALAAWPSEYKVLGGIDSFRFQPGDMAVLAIGDPRARHGAVQRLQQRVDFFTFIPPGTVIGKQVRIGRGVVAGLDCMFTTNIEIGDFALINCHSSIAHDVRIGAYASLLGNVSVCGKCTIGDAALLGASSTIIPGRRIGRDAVVGAGAVVFRNVPPGVTVVGNPARVFIGAERLILPDYAQESCRK